MMSSSHNEDNPNNINLSMKKYILNDSTVIIDNGMCLMCHDLAKTVL